MTYLARPAAQHGSELSSEITEDQAHGCAGRSARGAPPARETRFLGAGALCARYDVSRRTLSRWIVDPPSGFPASIVLRGRHLWRVDELQAWEVTLIKSAASTA
jgi:hypothetical protein